MKAPHKSEPHSVTKNLGNCMTISKSNMPIDLVRSYHRVYDQALGPQSPGPSHIPQF